ncbi:hypothetical protein NPIL_660111 [Nephila pilipes]|uniref:Uncharacterized protein n=1 Tax=Nephila pilipes TaxID=299642 RepID=A0A8X6IIM1_NEPPI|nr:hypothetical protein NPIL_660111 [Nephila pilipes]
MSNLTRVVFGIGFSERPSLQGLVALRVLFGLVLGYFSLLYKWTHLRSAMIGVSEESTSLTLAQKRH